VQALRANQLRSALTMLGIVIAPLSCARRCTELEDAEGISLRWASGHRPRAERGTMRGRQIGSGATGDSLARSALTAATRRP
jgi:hypothetical protein